MFKSKHLFWGVILLCVLFISSASASAPRFLSYLKMSEAELIIIGTVSNQKLLSGKTEMRKISNNSYSVSFTFDGMIYHIKVEEVLLDKRQAKGNGSKKLSDVFAFVPYPFSNVSPGCVKGERYLVFLDRLDIDPRIVKKHQLKRENTYAFLSDIMAAARQLSSAKETPSISQYIKENLQYAELTKVFFNVMKIRDSAERLEQLKGLLEDLCSLEDPWLKDQLKGCTAIGNLDHSLNQDCDTITIRLKGASDGKTQKIHPPI